MARLPALPLFDEDDTDDVREAGQRLMEAAQELVDLKNQVKPKRPWRPSDNLTPAEVAMIDADDWMF